MRKEYNKQLYFACLQQVTSAIIHTYHTYMEYPEGSFNSGSILGERIPEEDVRIVETMENSHHHDSPVLPGIQRRKLYFNPAYFERQLLLVGCWTYVQQR